MTMHQRVIELISWTTGKTQKPQDVLLAAAHWQAGCVSGINAFLSNTLSTLPNLIPLNALPMSGIQSCKFVSWTGSRISRSGFDRELQIFCWERARRTQSWIT